jgi:hypothetical protein
MIREELLAPVIPFEIVYRNVNPQSGSALFNLPLEIMIRTFFLASGSSGLDPHGDILTTLWLSLSCKTVHYILHQFNPKFDTIADLPHEIKQKLMKLPPTAAHTLLLDLLNPSIVKKRQMKRVLHGMLRLSPDGGPLFKFNLPQRVLNKYEEAPLIRRALFMDKLSAWLRKEDGWALCSICLVYKRIWGGSLGAEPEGWKCVKREMAKPAEKRFEAGLGTKTNVDLQEAGWTQAIGSKELHWICHKHRFGWIEMARLQ